MVSPRTCMDQPTCDRHRSPLRMSAGMVATLAGVLLSLAGAGAAATLYRWVDDEGVVHYSDRVPPSEIQRGRTEISNTGVRLETVPPAKTPEERARERELERARAERQRLIDAQAAADARLLRTYHSVDDIHLARSTKLASIDAAIEVTRSLIRLYQGRLVNLYGEAGDMERAGKAVPEDLRARIASAETMIRNAYTKILEHERQRREVHAGFERDLARYQRLVEPTEAAAAPSGETEAPPPLTNLVTCADAAECDRLWPLAVAYVRRHATTPIHLAGDRLIVTAAPRKAGDVGLILSRIADGSGAGEALFLDVQCHRPRQDGRTCQDPRAPELITGFRAALDRGAEEEPPMPEPR